MLTQTICLNMIVKNEGAVIEETLANILQHCPIHYWVISDTGSSDDTREKIQRFFAKHQISGELYQDVWQDFSTNRNIALDYCAGKSDYILFFDADDRFEHDLPLPHQLEDEAYYLKVCNEGNRDFIYYRPLLIQNNQQFYWKSVLHEFLEHRHSHYRSQRIEGDYVVVSGRFGARSQDPQKYLKDALVLCEAFQEAPEDLKPRYAFYCAQSYRDAGHDEKAIYWYQKRISLGGWREEVTCSYENIGLAYERLAEKEKALSTWLAGYDYDASRAECLYHAIRLLRTQGQCCLAYRLLQWAKAIVYPESDILFVNQSIYHFWLDFELSICAYYVKDSFQGYQACKRVLLANPSPQIAGLTLYNLQFYLDVVTTESVSQQQEMKALIEKNAIFLENPDVLNVLVKAFE